MTRPRKGVQRHRIIGLCDRKNEQLRREIAKAKGARK